LLSDFGLVKLAGSSLELTGSGAGIGTPAYMSPEQGQGRPVDPRTDIYALGVILFEMLTGHIPHYADTPLGLLLNRATQPAPSPRVFNPYLPEVVEGIIFRALARQPDERFQSATDLAQALKAAVQNLPQEERTLLSPGLLTPPVQVMPIPVAQPPGPTPPGSSLPIPPPPEPSRPTLVPHFVGRELELAAYAGKLAREHLAVITGMTGVGKTSLAVHLAYRVAVAERIFWHTLHPNEGLEVIIWSLAAFLAGHGQVELWHMLQSARLTGGKPPPIEVLIDYVVQAIRGQNFLLCLDDLHYVMDESPLSHFFERLHPLLQAGEAALLITSRRVPHFLPTSELAALPGLSEADMERLLTQNGLSLPPELAAQLYQRTEGNAELLTLAMNVLKQASQPERILDRLAAEDDIER
jgi:hypothetical protein